MKKQSQTDINQLGGFLPPSNTELESTILGECMLDKEALGIAITLLVPDCFYMEANKVIYQTIYNLYSISSPVDILTVVNSLKANSDLEKVGGAFYISQLCNRVASASNIEYHCRIIVQDYLKRKLIQVSQESSREAYDNTSDVFDLYETATTKLDSALSGVIKYEVSTIGAVHKKVIAESMEVAKGGAKSGVPTGFTNLDKFLSGWQKSDLIILAARPSMGKSACALAFVLNPALDGIPTAMFSLEMSNDQLVGRTQSMMSGINSSRIIKKQLEPHEVTEIENACSRLNTTPIYIDDTPSLSLMALKAKSRKLVKEKKVKLIVVDYLQLMTVDTHGGNREQEVSTISKGLKGLAKELDIPIIALSQLNRAVETRGGDKKPMLSDLRESGSIEQDADMVMFVYRPEYYGAETYEIGGEVIPTEGLLCLIVAKHRAGSLGELRMGFNGSLTKLENYDTYMAQKNRSSFDTNNNLSPLTPNANFDNEELTPKGFGQINVKMDDGFIDGDVPF